MTLEYFAKNINNYNNNLVIYIQNIKDIESNILIADCPQCGKLARTPQAKQCRHCGFDWH